MARIMSSRCRNILRFCMWNLGRAVFGNYFRVQYHPFLLPSNCPPIYLKNKQTNSWMHTKSDGRIINHICDSLTSPSVRIWKKDTDGKYKKTLFLLLVFWRLNNFAHTHTILQETDSELIFFLVEALKYKTHQTSCPLRRCHLSSKDVHTAQQKQCLISLHVWVD